MFTKMTIPVIVALVMISYPQVSACFVEKTTYTESTMTIINPDCTKTTTLYSGTHFIEESGVWKPVTEAKSLLNVWDVIYLETDSRYSLSVEDYNFTTIKLCANTIDSELGKQIPLKYCDKTIEPSALQLQEEICSEKMELTFNQKVEQCFYVDMNESLLKYNFTFGDASTTIILQDADTEILEDNYISSYPGLTDNNYGTQTALKVGDSGLSESYREESMIKADISGISGVESWVSSDLCLFINVDGFESGEYANITALEYDNQSWGELEMSWDVMNFAQVGDVLDYNTSYDGDSDDYWVCLDILSWISSEYAASKDNISLYINTSGFYQGNIDEITIASKEYTTDTSKRPYIIMTYNPYAPEINSNSTYPSIPYYLSTANISANVTDSDGQVVYVNFTVQSPNNDIYFNGDNGTAFHGSDIWNSSNFDINQTGDYNVTITATDDNGYTTTQMWNFTVSLGTMSVLTPDADHTHEFSILAGNTEYFNLTINVSLGDGLSNSTFNFTWTDNLTNQSVCLLNLAGISNITAFSQGGSSNKSLINITINSSLGTGTYSGIINVSRQQDNSYVLIEVNFTVSSYAGDVDIVNTSFSMAKTTSESIMKQFLVWNKGNRNLTSCVFSTTNTLAVTIACDQEGFTVSNETNVTANCNFNDGLPGTDPSASVTLICVSTDGGGTDSDSISGSMTLTSLDTGGGGGGGSSQECTDYLLFPTEGYSGFADIGDSAGKFTFRINNGEQSQYFSATFSDEIQELCRLVDFPDSTTPANGIDLFVVECFAPNGTVEGTINFYTDTGCEDSRPILLSSQLDFFTAQAVVLFNVISADLQFSDLFIDADVFGVKLPVIIIFIIEIMLLLYMVFGVLL